MSDSTSMFITYILELYAWGADEQSLKLYWPTIKRAAEWAMSTCAELDLPHKLETTYDILGFPRYDVSTYASVFHLLAMRATAELAKAMGDSAFEQKAKESYSKTRTVLEEISWVPSGKGFFSALNDKCSKDSFGKVSCKEQIGFFSDAFYAQVLAYSAGLDDLVDREKLKQHLNTTIAKTCKQPQGGKLVDGCPTGLITVVDKATVESTDWQMWQMATHDWAVLNIHASDAPDAVPQALEYSRRSAVAWSEVINDQWNTAGISDTSGYPTVTSHYGYHMTSWHIPLALSGQKASLLPEASLTFSPKIGAPFSLPVYLPGVLGTLSCTSTSFTLALTAGSLRLKVLSVGSSKYPVPSGGFVEVRVSSPVTWEAETHLKLETESTFWS